MILSRLTLICLILISSKVYSQIPDRLKNTNWEQEGYDRVLAIKDSRYFYYNLNDYTCSILAEGDFKGRFEVIDINKNNLILNPGGIVNYRFKKIDSVPSKCKDGAYTDVNYIVNFKSFWQTFKDNYAFFHKREINWNEIYREYFSKIKKVETEQEFALLLKEIISKFEDGHINLEIPETIFEKTKPSTTKNTAISKEQIESEIIYKYVENPKSYNNGVIKWGKLKDKNIGYIGISDMNGFANYVPKELENSEKFDSVFNSVRNQVEPLNYFRDEINGVNKILPIIKEDLKETKAMIVDIRFNGGGYETVALELLSYFIDKEKEIISIKAKKENGFTGIQNIRIDPKENSVKSLHLLISPFTASAAEIFALGALSYSNIEIYGSASSGIFSEILWKELPIGWEFSLSNEVYLDPRGKSYEGSGIPVDYEFNYSKDRSKFYQSFYSKERLKDKILENLINSDF
jgi:C-terminal processing protease CtpA/Prc